MTLLRMIISVHVVKRVVTCVVFSCVSLYSTAPDSEPFHKQWYGNGTYDPCGHSDLPSQHNENVTCAKCMKAKSGEPWVHCPSCDF